MSDLCECVCEYIWAMRRVLAALQTQTHCTDTECFTEYPGYEPGSGDSSSGVVGQTVLFALIWVVIAVILFLLRPSSLRGSPDSKPPPLRDDSDGQPPPPDGGEVQ